MSKSDAAAKTVRKKIEVALGNVTTTIKINGKGNVPNTAHHRVMGASQLSAKL